jgi:hypothetical protein
MIVDWLLKDAFGSLTTIFCSAFSRDSEGWSVDLKRSKTGTHITGRLADCLTPFLDAVLMMDTAPAYLWKIYDQRVSGWAGCPNIKWSSCRALRNISARPSDCSLHILAY